MEGTTNGTLYRKPVTAGLPAALGGGVLILVLLALAFTPRAMAEESRETLYAQPATVVIDEHTQGRIVDHSFNPANAEVQYSLSGRDAGDFRVTDDGIVHNVRGFDYSETRDRELNFNVVATFVHADFEDFDYVKAVTVTVRDTYPNRPRAPKYLTAEATAGSVTLNWLTYRDPTITGYQVLRKKFGCNCRLQVHVENTGSAAKTYTDTDVEPGTRYVYRVQAINAGGIGHRSNYVRVTAN